MKQELRFCAEVYRLLHDRIDQRKRVLFCLDGAPAKEAFRCNEIGGETVPDLCFTLLGAKQELRIEAKIIEDRRVVAGRNQKRAWSDPDYALAPHLWIAADEALEAFYLWPHYTFRDEIAKKANSNGRLLAFGSGQMPSAKTLRDLVSAILAWAARNGLGPETIPDHG